jgi:hypothetical protein
MVTEIRKCILDAVGMQEVRSVVEERPGRKRCVLYEDHSHGTGSFVKNCAVTAVREVDSLMAGYRT